MTISSTDIDYARRSLSEEELGEVAREVREEIEELKLGKYQFKPETRCRVCQSTDDQDLVNKLLSTAMPYTQILRILEPVNKARKQKQRITYNSLFVHAKNCFPTQKGAQSVYRAILEKKAEEYGQDYIRGTTQIANVFSYLEIMVQKGTEQLMSDENNVTVKDGMDAAVKLHDLVKDTDGDRKIREIMLQYNSLLSAVLEVADESTQKRILEHLKGGAEAEPLDVDFEDQDSDSDDGYASIGEAEAFGLEEEGSTHFDIGGSH